MEDLSGIEKHVGNALDGSTTLSYFIANVKALPFGRKKLPISSSSQKGHLPRKSKKTIRHKSIIHVRSIFRNRFYEMAKPVSL